MRVLIAFGGATPEHDPACQTFRHVYSRLRTSPPMNEIAEIAFINRDGDVRLAPFDPNRDANSYMDPAAPGTGITVLGLFEHARAEQLFVFVISYGRGAEDGHLQGVAEVAGVASNLGGVLGAAASTDKWVMSALATALVPAVKMPKTWPLLAGEDPRLTLTEIARIHHGPIVIKPNSLGSSILTERFDSLDDLDAAGDLVADIHRLDPIALIQQFVTGIELSVGCLEIDGMTKVLPAIRIESASGFFGQNEKFKVGHATETVIDPKTQDPHISLCGDAAKALFEIAHMRNYARMDFIVTDDGPYFLEVNALPGLLGGSLYTRMLAAHGVGVENLADIFIDNHRRRPRYSFDVRFAVEV